MQTAQKNSIPSQVGRLAAVVHAVVSRAPASCYADLKAEVTAEAARLRIPYDAETLTAAIALVERTRPVLEAPAPPTREPDPGPPAIPRDDARRILAELRARLGAPAVRPMPKARLVTPTDADKHQAMAIVLAQIAETAARCDALEREDG